MRHLICFLVLILFIIGCTTGPITMIDRSEHYSSDFLKKVESIQIIYRDGDKQLALQKLNNIPDELISNAEKAKKYNLIGVIHFSRNNLDKAIENFQYAKQNVEKDYHLASQINLNLASGYYKVNQYELSRSILKAVNIEYFNKKEKNKYYKLNLTLANQLSDSKEVVNSLIYLMSDLKRFSDIEDYQYKELLTDKYRLLSPSERVYFLEKYDSDAPIVVAYLAKIEVLQRFYQGDKSGANDVLSWLEGKFSQIEEVKNFSKDYRFRMENFSKIDSKAVGVVVPLSGGKAARYGKSVLAGINTALEKSENKLDVNFYIKDNKNNKFLAKKMVQELVMKHNVSVIIGGLFPKLAYEEYMEARKYGVLYISLSQVYADRQDKSHLLIELQGSVESQINTMLQPKALEYFGKNMAIFYPWDNRGKSYLNEMWGHYNSGNIDLRGIGSFEVGSKQFTDPVKKMLWLKNQRERKEELLIWKEIRDLEKRNFRIINEMPPIVDFDWVFVPSLPSEAIQIIPTFSYFDAKKLKFIGGPSWRNRTLKKEQGHLGNSYLIGNDIVGLDADFKTMYKEHNKKSPKLVDTLSYESILIVDKILSGENFSKRDDLDKKLITLKNIKGLISNWNLSNGLWLKDMDIIKISSKGFSKVELK